MKYAHCFCCGIKLVEPLENDYNCYPALIFISNGNWNSTIFDSVNGSKLEIKICDKCVTDRIDHVNQSGPDKCVPLRKEVLEYCNNAEKIDFQKTQQHLNEIDHDFQKLKSIIKKNET